jgi:spore germination protein
VRGRSRRQGSSLPGLSRGITVVACAVLSSACAAAGRPTTTVTPASSGDFFVTGYHPYWAGASWTGYPLDLLDELYFFETEAGADGTLADLHGWPTAWEELVAQALAEGVRVIPTVSMHDATAFEAVFTDAGRIDRLVESSLGLLSARPEQAGIHLDFEVFQPVSVDARDGFTAFAALLAERLRARYPGRSLSIFALAFDDDDAYNERTLGVIADYLVVQGYDYYYMDSETAGPVGATDGWGRLNWDYVVDRFEAFGVPRKKIVMGVPLYGYEWPVESADMGAPVRGTGRTIPYTAPADVLPEAPRARDRAAEAGVQRDPQSRVPWYALETPNGWVQGWYDDPESLRHKYDFVRARGLGGIALFPLTYGDAAVWAGVREAFPGR